MPTINKIFLLKLILVVVVLAGALVGTHAIQSGRIPDALRRQAERATADGKTNSAIRYLQQYLEFRPNDIDVQDRLAELLREKSGDDARSSLIFLYDKILRADPSRHATRREALKLCLRVGRYTDAAAHADTLLKEFPTDAELWQQLAAAQAGLRQNDAAVRSYETALKHDPTNLTAFQRLAQFHWRDLRNPDAAKQVIDRMVAALPNEPQAYLTRAKFLTFTLDSLPKMAADPVLADLNRALELAPANPDAAIMKADRLQRHRNLHEAFACLSDALKHNPGHVQLVRNLAWLEVNRGNTGGAIAILEDGLANASEGSELLVPLADLLLGYGDTARTEEIIQKLDRRAGPVVKLQAKYLRGRLAMQQRRWDDAAAVLTELRTDAARLPGLEAQANLLLAACHRHRGNTEQELECLKLIVAKDPAHLSARVALGQIYLDAGQFNDAIREYEIAAQSPFAAGSVCAMLIRLKAARLATTGGKAWADLERQLAEFAPRFGPGASEPVLLLAGIATAAGNPQRAATILRSEAARRPGDVRLWAALAEATADAAGVAAGLAIIDEAMSATGDGVELRLARANLYARDPARLRPVSALEAQTDTWPDADQNRLLNGLIEVYDRIGDEPAVIRLYRRLASRRPNDLAVWEAFYQRAVAAQDQDAAAVALAAVKRLDGEDGPGVVLANAWAALAGDDPSALATIREQLVKTFGANPVRGDACLALARLHARGGDPTEATQLFARAARLEPIRFEPTRAYLAHLAAIQDDAGLTRQLARLAADPRWSGDPFRRVVRNAAGSDPATAKKLLAGTRRFVELEPGGLGWLADCYRSLKLDTEAIAVAEAAVNSKLATADDWLRLALIHPTGGKDILATAAKTLPLPAFAAVAAAYAESPAAAGWQPELPTSEVRRAFTQARLSLKLARLERAEAISLLETYLDPEDLPAADAGWARRNLSMLLVIRGEPRDRKRAMKIIAADAAIPNKTIEEKRSTAAVLTSLYRYLDGDDRQTVLGYAIAVIEDLAAAGGTPRDGYILTQLYRAADQAGNARNWLNKLLQTDPKNIDYLLAGLDILIEANELADAEAFAQRLLQMYPSDFRAVAAVARYEVKAKRPEAAFDLVKGYVRTADATGLDLTAKLVRAAELIDELSRKPGVARTPIGRDMTDWAVTKYKTALAGRAEAVIAIAGLLAADGRTAEAFAEIERAGRVMTARSLTAAGLAALRAGDGTDREFAKVKAWLDAGRGEEPDSIALRLSEAEFYALKHDYAAAARAYEDVLNLDPRNVIALNNLAWILAPRPQESEKALDLINRAIRETGVTAELLDTRARVRIAAKQFAPAEDDLREALKQGKTPLRLFHSAMAKLGQSPPKREEAEKAFREATERGLRPKAIHPDDLPMYRTLSGGDNPGSE
jgi:tetratricopeptide (TPR) repeat protein